MNDKAFLEILATIEDPIKKFKKLQSDFDTAVAQMDAAAKSVDFDPASTSAGFLKQRVIETGTAMNRFARANARGQKEVAIAIDGVDGKLKKLGKTASFTTKLVAKAGAALGAAFVVSKIVQFARAMIDASLSVERYKDILESVSSSQKQANDRFEFATRTARDLGVAVEPLIENYAKLVATTRGTKLEGKLLDEVFVNLTKALRGSGADSQKTSQAFTALEQIISKGRVSSEELRQQMAEALPGSMAIAARSVQKAGESFEDASSRLNKMLEAGQLGSVDFVVGFAQEAADSVGDLSGALDSNAAKLERFKTSLFLVNGELGTQFLDAYTDSLGRLASSAEEVPDSVSQVGSVFGAAAGEITIGASRIVDAFVSLNNKTKEAFNTAQLDVFQRKIKNLAEGTTVAGLNELQSEFEGFFLDLQERVGDSKVVVDQYGETIDAAVLKVKSAAAALGRELAPSVQKTIDQWEALKVAQEVAVESTAKVERKLSEASKELLKTKDSVADLNQGVTDLTEAYSELESRGSATIEQQIKLGDTAATFAEKYRAIGEEVPASVQLIIDSIGGLTEGARKLFDAVDSFDALNEKSRDLVSAFEALNSTQDLTIEQSNLVAEKAKEIEEAYEALGLKAPESVTLLADAYVLTGEKLDEFKLKTEELTESIKTDVEKLADSLGKLSQQRDKLSKKDSGDTRDSKKNVDSLEKEKEALESVQNQQTLSLEESDRLLEIDQEIRDAKDDLTSSILDQKTATDELAVAQAAQEKISGAANSIVDDAKKGIEDLKEGYGEFGEQASGSLDLILENWKLQSETTQIAGSDVENLSKRLQDALLDAQQQAQSASLAAEKNRELGEGARDAGEGFISMGDDAEGAERRIEKLGGSAKDAQKSLEELSKTPTEELSDNLNDADAIVERINARLDSTLQKINQIASAI